MELLESAVADVADALDGSGLLLVFFLMPGGSFCHPTPMRSTSSFKLYVCASCKDVVG